MTRDSYSVSNRRASLLAALLVGALAAAWVGTRAVGQPEFTSDFDQLWAAARALIEGRDPYLEVGPNAPFHWKWPLYYPLPAVLLVSPLGYLPLVAARMAFAGVSAGLFTWAMARDGWRRWPIFLSIAFLVTVDLVQWPLLLVAAWFLPALGGVVVAKPNFSLPAFAGDPTRRRVISTLAAGAVLLALSLVLQPGWPAQWLSHVREAPHFRAPVQYTGGFVLLLAALKWRRPEARWLLALALTPQAPSFYDPLLLVVACTTWWETGLLAIGTWVMFFAVGQAGPQPDYAAWGALTGRWAVWACYLPCLVMVLRRPNEGALPSWRRTAA